MLKETFIICLDSDCADATLRSENKHDQNDTDTKNGAEAERLWVINVEVDIGAVITCLPEK